MPVVREIDMHMYAKCDQNIPCGSRAMSIFTYCYRTDRLTHIVIIVQTQGLCNVISIIKAPVTSNLLENM